MTCLMTLTSSVMAGDLQPGDVLYGHNENNHKAYKQLYREVNGGVSKPGDVGYRLDEFQGAYKKVYDAGKCACRSGYCRATNIRLTEYGSPTGYDIKINGAWHPVPMEAMQNEHTLSRELMRNLFYDGTMAHVCAYPDVNIPGGQRIECAIWETIG